MAAWVRRRLLQIDALISPDFLDLSARSAKIDFDEQRSAKQADLAGGHYAYEPVVELRFWKIDEGDDTARSQTALEWVIAAGLAAGLDEGSG